MPSVLPHLKKLTPGPDPSPTVTRIGLLENSTSIDQGETKSQSIYVALYDADDNMVEVDPTDITAPSGFTYTEYQEGWYKFDGTITDGQYPPGESYTLTFSYEELSADFTVTVNVPEPEIDHIVADPDSVSIVAGEDPNQVEIEITAYDIDDQSVDYDPGDISFSASDDRSVYGHFSHDHVFEVDFDDGSVGQYSVTVTLTDGEDTFTDTISVTISDYQPDPDPPEPGPGPGPEPDDPDDPVDPDEPQEPSDDQVLDEEP